MTPQIVVEILNEKMQLVGQSECQRAEKVMGSVQVSDGSLPLVKADSGLVWGAVSAGVGREGIDGRQGHWRVCARRTKIVLCR